MERPRIGILAAVCGLLACSGAISGDLDRPGGAERPGRPGAGPAAERGETAGAPRPGVGAEGARPAGPAPSDPGRPTIRRLNRTEYNNTIRDLLGVDARPADRFPADGRSLGFDVVGDALSTAPVQVEMYVRAAQGVVDEALREVTPAAAPRLVACDPATGEVCQRTIVARFARRAFRRPASTAELDRLMKVVATAKAQGDPPGAGIRAAFAAILSSPHFVFRVETDPAPTSAAPHPLTSHELAARLSYFLWSTTPDDALAAAADADQLRDPSQLRAELRRMLADPRTPAALAAGFAAQWLQTRALPDHDVDPKLFPSFDDPLREAMSVESELLFRELMGAGAPVADLARARFTFANERLAKHLGVAGVTGRVPKRIEAPHGRRGVLGLAGVLTVTSHADGTSPVRRGVWLLNQLLCAPPPPPPPGVEGLAEAKQAGGSARQRLEAHRASPACAGCHSVIDPLGFGLEHFDAVGRFRERDGALVVDATGTLPDGRRFEGAAALAELVAGDPRFTRCFVEKLYTYALGRAPEPGPDHLDGPTLDRLAAAAGAGRASISALLEQIALSVPFTARRGEP